MLSQTATDVLNECDYERVRAQLHQALRGDGNPPQGERFWLAGRHVSMWRGGGRDDGNAQNRRTTA
ncbi:hypothetical protein LMG19083_01139 [Ralstonia psammae]|uniref:Uncharacterized protein n=1 Tax=Ralstonia psammae TaxID=3058598 RepID=A0ABN9IIR6_9RALS|nr:hypothetical protein [Ralstonia sp. LMG 19083]CAJ0784191.1 hypothetical protein LMG19083_01139 [Ralstonia sp. LMG 19083]